MAKVYDSILDLVGKTPLVELKRIEEKEGLQAKLIAKVESFNPAGSVKDRIAKAMIEDAEAKGLLKEGSVIIEPTSGNTGIGLAAAATVKGYRMILTMPETMSVERRNIVKAYGAEVILYGDVYDESCAYALELAEDKGYTFIHPFDDLDVATGQGSVAMEIIKELPFVYYILVPIGGGGLATGVSTLAKMMNPNIKVIGVEPAGANCMQVSLKNKKVTTLPYVDTIADGTAVKTPGSKIFPYIQKNIDDIITVEDNELIVSFLDMLENHKLLVENSGLLTVAALKHLDVKGAKVVSILSGGNMDMITFASLVQHGLIARSRIFTVSTLLPDKPGALMNISKVIADLQGNVIKLEHNQFVSINRNSAVELVITMEAFGPEHKQLIINTLADKGYKPKEVMTKGIYN